VLAATQTPGTGGTEWFQGTADAVRQYSWLFADTKNKDVEHVVILSGTCTPLLQSPLPQLTHPPITGDHLYRMDYMDFVQKHVDTGVRRVLLIESARKASHSHGLPGGHHCLRRSDGQLPRL
jgi:glucose-1-phosphate adenylyltransferase